MSADRTLGHRTRKMVYSYISAHPGVTFSTIMDVLDLSEGTLRYHLNYLKRGDKILARTRGKHRCFYVKNATKSMLGFDPRFDRSTLSRPQQRIITIIQQHPGINISELVKITKLTKRDMQYNLKRLRDELIIWKVGNGRSTAYEYVTKEKLRAELLKLLIYKFLNNEIDEETYLQLKEQLE